MRRSGSGGDCTSLFIVPDGSKGSLPDLFWNSREKKAERSEGRGVGPNYGM